MGRGEGGGGVDRDPKLMVIWYDTGKFFPLCVCIIIDFVFVFV